MTSATIMTDLQRLCSSRMAL